MTTLKIDYKLSPTGENSAKFGNCECCNKHVSDVYIMSAIETYSYELDGKTYTDTKRVNLPFAFGHMECLFLSQK